MKKIQIGLLIGIIAGIIDVIPMIIQKLTWDANISAFAMWVVVGFLIATIDLKIIPILKGIVIAFLAPKKLRFDRICARGRADDSPQAFDGRDQREIAYGTAIPIVLADAYVLNTGTMDDAMEQLDAIVRKETEIM